MRPIYSALTALSFLTILFVSTVHASAITASEPLITTGTVYRAVDGDTYDVNLSSAEDFQRVVIQARGNSKRQRYLNHRFQTIRVRLANIDTPESKHPDSSRNTQHGRDISGYVKGLIEGQKVELRCHDWGNYGRSICNVSASSHGDIGLHLIKEGYSTYVTRWGKNPYFHREYQEAARQAQ